MSSDNFPDDIYIQVQAVFRSNPTVLVGSGFSCGYGLPGMGMLGEHLVKVVGPRLIDADAENLWSQHIENIKSDLEKGLNNIASGAPGREILVSIVREETARLIQEKTQIAEQAILSKQYYAHAPSRLLKRLYDGAPRNTESITVITTNYDTLIELFCDIANLPIDTGFAGYRHRWARKNPTFETQYRRGIASYSKGVASYHHTPCLTIRLLKPHGSINWHSTPSGPVEVLHNHHSGPQSIVIPGPSKYEDSLVNILFDSVRTEMNSVVSKSQGLIAIGFGFNDNHLQGVIESRLGSHMPAIIITRDFTDNIESLLRRFPHIIAVRMDGDGSACHHENSIYRHCQPIWQLDHFLHTFLE